MTTYRAGDKVRTSHPGFDPDYVWEFSREAGTPMGYSFIVSPGSFFPHLPIPTASLTLVEPPLPPEPPVGSVVFHLGLPWIRTGAYERQWATRDLGERDGWRYVDWGYLAADAVPAVNPSDPDSLAAVSDEQLQAAGLCRVEDAADWMRTVGEGTWPVRVFRDRFGPEASDE